MPTRRDTLKIAAALAATGGVPFAVPPAEAAALLDLPANLDPGPGRQGTRHEDDDDMLNPVAFAEALDGADIRDWFVGGAPEVMAAYYQAREALTDALPELEDVPFGHPFGLMDEAAVDGWTVAWMAGVRAGAAYEHLRLAMVAPRVGCSTCHLKGRLWNGSPHRITGATAETCPVCGGTGTVPTPAPRLAGMVPPAGS